MNRLAIATAAVMIVGLVVAACGGGAEDPPTGLPDQARDPISATELLLEYNARHDWAASYELVHPDMQRTLTHDQFADLMESRFEGVRLQDWKVTDARRLSSWRDPETGVTYSDVAEVLVEVTVVAQGEEQTGTAPMHLVAVDGYYRFFPVTEGE